MKFNLKGYYPGYEFKYGPGIRSLDEYQYIQFSSPKAREAIMHFIVEEMHQGHSLSETGEGREVVANTGFFEMYKVRPSWTKFRNEFCPIVLYSYEIEGDVVWLSPLNVFNDNAYRNKDVRVLKI